MKLGSTTGRPIALIVGVAVAIVVGVQLLGGGDLASELWLGLLASLLVVLLDGD